ncbi:hypothetical protein ACIPSA_48395 [Streptomyces sp. NPDC086549]|uniref:hypothetical protein n=1 Tax=Streptomyces sp. NPDC086549 TaxID=3365752 RepID=UPI0038109084
MRAAGGAGRLEARTLPGALASLPAGCSWRGFVVDDAEVWAGVQEVGAGAYGLWGCGKVRVCRGTPVSVFDSLMPRMARRSDRVEPHRRARSFVLGLLAERHGRTNGRSPSSFDLLGYTLVWVVELARGSRVLGGRVRLRWVKLGA